MFSDASEECLERAAECRLEARCALRAEERAAWLALAEEWERLAERSTDAPPQTEPKREAA